MAKNAPVVCLYIVFSSVTAFLRSQARAGQRDSTIHNPQIVIFFSQPASRICRRLVIQYNTAKQKTFKPKTFKPNLMDEPKDISSQ